MLISLYDLGKIGIFFHGSMTNPLCKVAQWLQLFLLHKIKFGDEIIEVLVAGVHMGFGPESNQLVEVVNINMDEDTEETCEDLFNLREEIPWKRRINFDRESLFIIDLRLHPVHEEGNILWGR